MAGISEHVDQVVIAIDLVVWNTPSKDHNILQTQCFGLFAQIGFLRPTTD